MTLVMPIAQKNAQASSSRLPLRNGRGNTDPIDDGSDSDDQRVRAPRGKLNGRAAVRVDEAEEEDGWTVETFHDRPIEKDNVVLHMVSNSSRV